MCLLLFQISKSGLYNNEGVSISVMVSTSTFNNIAVVTVEHVLPQQNAMSPVGFDPRTSHIVSHRFTNRAKGDFHERS
jgi:hypothetical protein